MTRTRALIVAIVLLMMSAGFADVQVFRLGGRITTNQQSTIRALCAYRDDIQHRVQSTVAYLASHPNGILGIPAATIRLSLTNEQHALTALSSLKC